MLNINTIDLSLIYWIHIDFLPIIRLSSYRFICHMVYALSSDITSKPKSEYETDEYFALDLPVARAGMAGDDIVVEGSDLSDYAFGCVYLLESWSAGTTKKRFCGPPFQ